MPDDLTVENRGRPAHEFTADQVQIVHGLVLQGVPYQAIARALGVAVSTLKKHLGATLDDAKGQRLVVWPVISTT
jgi:hypothetical protein